MKSEFFEFYRPTDEEFALLWSEALIVLDTNVLLDLYRTPTDARDQFLEILEKVKDHLWIPFQVGLEFHRNRPKVISDKGKNISEVLSQATKSFGSIRDDVKALDLDKYGLGIESGPLLAELQQAHEKLSAAIQQVHASQLSVTETDTIQVKLFELYQGRVGPGPANQKALDDLLAGADKRYQEKIPPGYDDNGKSKDPNDAHFHHNSIKYERRFGDLIFWKQILTYALENKIRRVMLISSEKKEDWWKIESGKRIGPQPELTREIFRDAGVETFWMYPPDQFMKFAAGRTNVTVTEQALAEVRNASIAESRSGTDIPSLTVGSLDASEVSDYTEYTNSRLDKDRSFRIAARRIVACWLELHFNEVNLDIYPDATVRAQGINIGFEVVPLVYEPGFSMRSSVVGSYESLMEATEENQLDAIFLVIVMTPDHHMALNEGIPHRQRNIALRTVVRNAISGLDLNGAYIGIYVGSRFKALAFVEGLSGDIWQNTIPAIKF